MDRAIELPFPTSFLEKEKMFGKIFSSRERSAITAIVNASRGAARVQMEMIEKYLQDSFEVERELRVPLLTAIEATRP